MEFLAPTPGKIITAPGGNVEMVTMSPMPAAVIEMFLHSVGDIRSLFYQLNAATEYVARLEMVVKSAAEASAAEDPQGSLAEVAEGVATLDTFFKLSPGMAPEWWPSDTEGVELDEEDPGNPQLSAEDDT
jgi:hypothetical protein